MSSSSSSSSGGIGFTGLLTIVFITLKLLDKEPLKVKSWQHDLVCNGYEVGGGSIRIHEKELQSKIFDIMKISREDADRRFGVQLRHPGLDRLAHRQPSVQLVSLDRFVSLDGRQR